MVAQTMYENVVEDVLKELTDDGLLVRSSDQTLWTYENGAWSVISPKLTAHIERRMYAIAKDHAFPFAEKTAGLWRTLRNKADAISEDEFDVHPMLALPNGTLDPLTGDLFEHDPEHMTTRRIAIDFDPTAKCPEYLKMLERCMPDKPDDVRAEYIRFLQEYFGMALIGFNQQTPRDLRKGLILYGASGTAKTSGVADVLREFFVPGELAEENVDQLSTSFGLARLVTCRALISDDAVSTRSKPDPNVLKKLITGEPMTANRKYKDAQSFRFRGPVVFTTNTKPKIDDESDALFNRTVLLTFDYEFKDSDKKLLGGKTPVAFLHAHEEFPGILNWALKGMIRARDNGRYSSIADASEASKVWRAENDPTFDFMTKYGAADKGTFCSIPMLSRMVQAYAEDEHGTNKLAAKTVTNRLRRETIKVVGGVRVMKDDKMGGEVLQGLRVSTDGLIWEARAKERGMVPPGVKWQINGKCL